MVIMTGAFFFFFVQISLNIHPLNILVVHVIVFKIDLLDQMLHKPIITHIPTCRKKADKVH